LAAALHTIIETTLKGLGYDLVELEFGGRGLLRVFIDFADWKAHEGAYINIEDCEKATRQLTHVLTVEDIDYARLEVSSPGVDRPLNTVGDFQRFAGQEVTVKLKKAFENRKTFQGVLTIEPDDKFGVVFNPTTKLKAIVPGKPSSKRATAQAAAEKELIAKAAEKKEVKGDASSDLSAHQLKLTFTLEEADRVRLVPQISFKQAADKGTAK
jgi:ribosome maturation factor RimP